MKGAVRPEDFLAVTLTNTHTLCFFKQIWPQSFYEKSYLACFAKPLPDVIHSSHFSSSSPPVQADTHRWAGPYPLLHHVMGVQVYQVPEGGTSGTVNNMIKCRLMDVLPSPLLRLLLLLIVHVLHEHVTRSYVDTGEERFCVIFLVVHRGKMMPLVVVEGT